MLLLVAFTYYIATVSSQCSQYFSGTCLYNPLSGTPPTMTGCTGTTPYHCDESGVNEAVGGGLDKKCVEHANICDTCSRLCELSSYSTLLAPQQTVDQVYVALECNSGVCTSPPTRSPILPNTPTNTPSISPTTTCSTYSCNPSAAPNSNCVGQPNAVYACVNIIAQSCTDIDSECSACCFGDTQKALVGPTRQQAFETVCSVDTACPTPDPTKAPSNNPSATPSNDPSSSPSK
eukprot:494721_1